MSILPGPVAGQQRSGLRRALALAMLAPVVAGSFSLATAGPVLAEDPPVIEAPVDLLAPVLNAVTAGKGSAIVNWAQTAQEGKLLSLFRIDAKQGANLKAQKWVLGDVRSATLTGLTNGEVYDVTVTAFSLLQASTVSNVISVTPLADAVAAIKSLAVQGLGVTQSKGSAVAEWDAPASDGGSPIVAYVVATVDKSTGLLHSWRNLAGDVRSASINGLLDGRAYDVAVFPVTGFGFGNISWITNILNDPTDEAPQTPVVPWFSAVKDGSNITANWGAATERGLPVLGYNIVLVQDGVMKAWATPGVDARAGSVGNYDPTKEAKVYMFASAIPGFGPMAAPITIAATPAAT